MLKKDNRLKTRFEYNITRKYGEHLAGTYAHVFILNPDNYSGLAKFGIVTSKKLHKSAVVRNKIKRIYADLCRKASSDLKNKWIVIQPKSTSKEKNYEEISTDFNKILQKISVAG